MSIQFCEACCEEKEIDSMICTDCQVEEADIEAEDAARLRARIEVLERQRDGLAKYIERLDDEVVTPDVLTQATWVIDTLQEIAQEKETPND